MITWLRSSNHVGLVDIRFVAHPSIFEQVGLIAVRWTAESLVGRGKRSTVVTVNTAPIPSLPEAGSAPDIRRSSVTFDVASSGMVSKHQRPCQEPHTVEEYEQCDASPPARQVPVEELDRCLLDLWEVRRDLQFTWRLWAFYPASYSTRCLSYWDRNPSVFKGVC
jgi:hypothetical protein